MTDYTPKPCPFCDHKTPKLEEILPDTGGGWRVLCYVCFAQIHIKNRKRAKTAALTAWNRRWAALRIKQEHAELVEALGGMMELVQLTQAGSVKVNTEWRDTIIGKADALIAKLEK